MRLRLNVRWLPGILFLMGGSLAAAQSVPLKPAQAGLVYGKGGDQTRTMDYYAGAGVGAHPMTILIYSGGGDEAAGTEILAAAGYNVFTIRYVASSQTVEDVERAIRYVRFHARDWNGDGKKVALIGTPDCGYLSTLAGLMNASGVMGVEGDAVDRESAHVQAVVAIFERSKQEDAAASAGVRALLYRLIREKAQEAALARATATDYVDPSAPAFLLMQGQFGRPTEFEDALRKAGVRCDSVSLGGWARHMEEWLNKTLGYQGAVGAESGRRHS